MSSFSSRSPEVPPALAESLRKYWGYESFRPLQTEAMLCVLQGRDSLVVLPTGGGKSLCFQAPAACLEGVALVVSPLISLMKDQVDSLRACGIPAAFLNSSLTPAERRQVAERMRRREVKLLYIAPERLLIEATLQHLATEPISLIAIDEAHCISTWGHEFRPEYRGLKVLKQRFPRAALHAYTATATELVRRDIVEQLGLVDPCVMVGEFDRPNLVYRVVRADNRFGQVCEILQRHRGESGIVYCISRREVDRMAENLKQLGFRAVPYHAGMPDSERRRSQDDFIHDRADIVVATIAFGMGIDKPNVRFVVHAGTPKSLENYQQESGRAGRDGLEAECVLLHSVGDLMVWRKMLDTTDSAARAAASRSLDIIGEFCAGVTCRHQALVQHFGQQLPEDNCGACDVCLSELDLVDDPLTLGQKILSCVLRVQQRFGCEYVAKVLTGSREQRIVLARHDSLSTYGILQGESQSTVRGWIDQLVTQGFLAKAGDYNVLRVTEAGQLLLRRQAELRLWKPAQRPGVVDALANPWRGVDRGLFDALRELRREKADQRAVSAHTICGDTALREMARRRPSTPSGLSGITGLGERKRADFGAEFVALIQQYCQRTGVDLDVAVVESQPSPTSVPQSTFAGPSAASVPAFEYFRRRAPIGQVAERLNRAHSTVIGYLNDFLQHERVTDPTPWVAPDTLQRIEHAVEQVGSDRLKPIFEQLSGEIGYDEIRWAVICIRNRTTAG